MFLRLFNVFDKPSESELAKYVEEETFIRDDILGMGDVLRATEILNDLEALKEKYKNLYNTPSQPVLMTHHRLQVHTTHHTLHNTYCLLNSAYTYCTFNIQQKYV